MERFELEPDRRARTYSTGNRQKVALVAAFATRAPLLVLDEPTSGLDPLMEREFRRCIGEAAERGQTVFLSSHQLAEVEAVCDRVGILRAGPAGRGGRLGGAAPAAARRRSSSTWPDPPPSCSGSRSCPASPTCGRRRTTSSRCRSIGPPGPGAAGAGRRRRGPARRAGALAGGDLPRLLRRGAGVTTGTASRPAAAGGRPLGRGPAVASVVDRGGGPPGAPRDRDRRRSSRVGWRPSSSRSTGAWRARSRCPRCPRWPTTRPSAPCSARRWPSTTRAVSRSGGRHRARRPRRRVGAC